ncbi:GyrI-like domain-containing protein [Orbaceae bacterium ac157xtp]
MQEINMCQGLSYKLKEGVPQLSDMTAQKVVSVEVMGDPNQETAKLMTPLYSTAYGIRKVYKEKGMPFKVEKLRGRWAHINITKSKDAWTGTYALPVPNDVTTLPTIDPSKNSDNVKITLEEWQYGKVAYILHVGSYANESGTIQILLDFISSKGMKIIENSHEEIYLSDPTKTSEDKLKTIILYRVEILL